MSNDVIYEGVVSTVNEQGQPNVAPLGVRYLPDGRVLLMPFKPSTTLNNILATRHAGHLGSNLRVAGALATERKWNMWAGGATPRPWATEYLEMARDHEAWCGLAPARSADAAYKRELVSWLEGRRAFPQRD